MSGGHLSKEFFELVKSIGESKSKQEEDRIILHEVALLKRKLNDVTASSSTSSGLVNKRKREFLIRLMYVEMLGHDASFGYIKAVEMTASTNLMQKRVGYLTCSLCLSPTHEFRFMIINQLQRDLQSSNHLEVCAALMAVCKLVTVEMVPAVQPMILDLLRHDAELVRKKAVMAIHRFHQLNPESVMDVGVALRRTLCDRDPSVMGTTLCILHDLAEATPTDHKDLVPSFVSILKQITERRLPREFDYHRIPAPWIQIRLLKILALLGQADQQTSEGMYEVLHVVMRRADTGINVGYAIIYECVRTVTTIYPNSMLLDAAAASISRFISSDNHNLKYLGVTGLAAIVKDHPRYAAAHQMAVIDCLEDPDETNTEA
uniref:Clathrin/coatomer adaptor adaptin-like N-terminal domain-containing protein n=1 Tax=Peronospora matthiolae TaxID=2874970 RepID=A0AAV1VMF9_9STRA